MPTDTPPQDPTASAKVEQGTLNRWAATALRMNHLGTLVQRAIREGSFERARALSERARVAAYSLFNELLIAGAQNAACDPEYPFVHWHHGLALEALGQREEARKQFDAFAQGLATVEKSVPAQFSAAAREKLEQYGLNELYSIKW